MRITVKIAATACAVVAVGSALSGCSATTSSSTPATSAPATSTSPTAKSTPAATKATAPAASKNLTSGNWEVVSTIKPVSTSGIMLLTIRVKNNGSDGSSLMTVTFLKGQDVAATCTGATNDQKQGATSTVQMICDKVLPAGVKTTTDFQAT